MSATPNLGLELIDAAQNQPEVKLNLDLRALDALVQATIISKSLTAPPGSPATGAAYIPASPATGAWAGLEDHIVWYAAGWQSIEAKAGWSVYNQADDTYYEFRGGSPITWQARSGGGGSSLAITQAGSPAETISPATQLIFTGATVTQPSPGVAAVSIDQPTIPDATPPLFVEGTGSPSNPMIAARLQFAGATVTNPESGLVLVTMPDQAAPASALVVEGSGSPSNPISPTSRIQFAGATVTNPEAGLALVTIPDPAAAASNTLAVEGSGSPSNPVQAARIQFAGAAVTNPEAGLALVTIAGATAQQIEYQVALSDLTTALVAGTNKAYFRAPRAFTLTEVRGSLLTASTGSPNPDVTVDVNLNTATILSTKLQIPGGSKTSRTGTPAVITTSAIADDDEFTFDIDAAGGGAAGLIVTLLGHL